MAGYPWREQYFTDIQKTLGGYWPFTEYRPYDFSSQYVNLDGWVRRSYEAQGGPDDQPTVWMFGGSTTWGEGQRDDYTIASWLARIAEDQGVPIRIANYGQRGWTHFQEMVLFEQQIELLDAPDVAVFYDGANEITSQSLIEEPVPTHTLTYQYSDKLLGTRIVTQVPDTPGAASSSPALWAAAVDAYRQHSALHKVVRYVRSEIVVGRLRTGGGAGASRPDGGFDDGFTRGQEVGRDGNIYNYSTTEQDGTRRRSCLRTRQAADPRHR